MSHHQEKPTNDALPTREERPDPSSVIDNGIATIDEHLQSVSKLPLQEEYKTNLKETLQSVQSLLVATKPILSHLDEVRSLIIAPVQQGVDKAFSESNKWGIRGIIISSVSLLVSIAAGIATLLPLGVRLGTYSTGSGNLSYAPLSGLNCVPPKIERILHGGTGSESKLFVYGDCLSRSRVSFAGLDLFISGEDQHLVELPPLPSVLPGEKPELRVSKIVAALSDVQPSHALSVHWERTDSISGARLIQTSQTSGGTVFFVSNSDKALSFEEGDKNRGAYEALVQLDKGSVTAVALWSLPTEVTLGNEPGYFGKSVPAGVSKSFEAQIPATALRGGKELVARVETFGIGPADTPFDIATALIVNGEVYDLLEANPFSRVVAAKTWRSAFLVHLKSNSIHEGRNIIEIRSGQYHDNDGRITFDNFVIRRLELLSLQ